MYVSLFLSIDFYWKDRKYKGLNSSREKFAALHSSQCTCKTIHFFSHFKEVLITDAAGSLCRTKVSLLLQEMLLYIYWCTAKRYK